MFGFIFFNFFTLSLIIGTIYTFLKKKYLNLYIPCFLFLPTYYGIDINTTLPILSVIRIMTIIVYIYAIINRRRDIHFDYHSIPKQYCLLACYFSLRIISNLYYVNTYTQSIKTILQLIFEQLFVLIAVYLLAPTKDEINSLIKSIIFFATILYIVGIIESYTGIRPFDVLFTTSREYINEHYVRLGLLRSTTTMLMPVLYGNMCILTLPMIFYTYELTRSYKYIIVMCFNILAIIHSGCRSDIFFLIIICMFYLIIVLKEKQRRVLFIKNACIIIVSILLFTTCMSFISYKYKYFYTGSAKAILNELGFNFDLSEGAPSDVEGYGVNSNGSASRIQELSGILYVSKINPLFGLGSEAQNRKQIQYYFNGNWYPSKVYDVGLVEIFCNEGLLGLLGISFLLLYLFLNSKHNKYCALAFITYLLSTLATGNMYKFLIVYVIICTCWNAILPNSE